MALQRSVDWTLWVGVAGVLAWGAPEATFSQHAVVDPCSGPTVAAYVSHVQSQCFLYRASALRQRSAATLNSPLHAGDLVQCFSSGQLTITFCASGADFVIHESDHRKYVVPNVPAKNRPATKGDSPALRHIMEKTTQSQLQGTVAQGGSSGIPTCDAQIGTLVVGEPQDKWWEGYGLASPAALIASLALQSKCFALIEAPPRPPVSTAQGGGGGNSSGGASEHALGSMDVDYVLVPTHAHLSNAYTTADERRANLAGPATVGGLSSESIFNKSGDPGAADLVGALAAIMRAGEGVARTPRADVVLELTDGRTAEQVARVEGEARGGNTRMGPGITGIPYEHSAALPATFASLVNQAYAEAFINLVKYVKTRRASQVNFYCDRAGEAVAGGAGTVDNLNDPQRRRFEADINSVRAAAGAMTVSVVSPPPGKASIVINDELVVADEHSRRMEVYKYAGFSLYRLTGTSSQLHLRRGENRLVMRYGDRSLAGYVFSCRALTEGEDSAL